MIYAPLFSLITVCHGRWHHLVHTLSTRLYQTYPRCEFVLVASGADNSPMAVLDEPDLRGRVVRVSAQHYRASYLRNLGAKFAAGELLGFVDADIYLAAEWAELCSEALRCADLVINQLLMDREDSGGATGTCAMQRWLFEKIRGYNENLDNAWGYEDTDLFVRAQRAGGRALGYPIGAVRHIGHSDAERQENFIDAHETARVPQTFIRHMQTCALDYRIHPYEANRVRRLVFPDDVVEITEAYQ